MVQCSPRQDITVDTAGLQDRQGIGDPAQHVVFRRPEPVHDGVQQMVGGRERPSLDVVDDDRPRVLEEVADPGDGGVGADEVEAERPVQVDLVELASAVPPGMAQPPVPVVVALALQRDAAGERIDSVP